MSQEDQEALAAQWAAQLAEEDGAAGAADDASAAGGEGATDDDALAAQWAEALAQGHGINGVDQRICAFYRSGYGVCTKRRTRRRKSSARLELAKTRWTRIMDDAPFGLGSIGAFFLCLGILPVALALLCSSCPQART